MRVWTLTELFRLTRAELFQLHREIVTELEDVPEESGERLVAVENLRLIRRVLTRPQFTVC